MNQQLIIPHEAPIHGSHNLPVRPPDRLLGRSADLTSVHLSLKAGTAVLLHGLPGTGKTALAAALASGYAELPGGVLWFEVANEALPSLLARVARAYGIDIAAYDGDTQTRVVSDLLAQNRPLIVLDGQVHVEQTRDFVRRCASGVPLLLTHARMVPGPWTPHAVTPLAFGDAEALLTHLGNVSPQPDVTRLSETLSGHPLSILVVARQLAAGEIGPGEFLARIPDLPSGDINRIMGVLMAAHRLLPLALQGLVLLLGAAFSSGASEELLSEVGGAPVSVIRPAMRQLVKRGFVSERAELYFSAHELVQTFAQVFLRGKKQLESMQARYLRGLLAYVKRQVDPAGGTANHDRLAAEMPNIMAGAVFAVRQGQNDFVEGVRRLLEPADSTSFVVARGFRSELAWLDYLVSHPDAAEMGLLARAEIPEPVQEIAPAPVLVDETPPVESIEPEMAENVQEQDTVQVQPMAVLGVEPLSVPEMPEETVVGPARSFQADGSTDDELAAIQALAAASLKQANYEDVLAYVDRGMALAQEADNPQREGDLLVVLGDMQAMLGRFEGAEVAYQEAISAFRPMEAWLDIGQTLDKLGMLYLDMDRLDDAITVWDQTVPIFQRENRPDELRSVLMKLGEAQTDLLRWDEALRYYTQALSLVQAAGDKQGMFDQLSIIGELLESRGDREAAVGSYQHALGLALPMGDNEQIGETLLALARLWMDDTTQLNRVVQLLEAADERLPGDTEIMRLLGRARARQERLTRAGIALLPPVARLDDFAASSAQ